MNDSENLLQVFRRLRYDYREDIPEDIVHINDGKYKVLAGWFNAISINTETTVVLGLVDEQCVQKRQGFVDYLKANEVCRQGRRTTGQDIQKGNETLDAFIACILDKQHRRSGDKK